MNINPPDVSGYTQMYSFGIKVIYPDRSVYMVMTVRAPTEKLAKALIWGIFQGNMKERAIAFYTDLEEWKREASPDQREAY